MAYDNAAKFDFTVSGQPEDRFFVARFSGREAINELYAFRIDCVSRADDVDFDQIVGKSAKLVIHGGRDDAGAEAAPSTFHGVVVSFEQGDRIDEYTWYTCVLAPKAWLLTRTSHNQVFLDKPASDFLAETLKDGGLSPGLDFSLSLQKSYPKKEYVCQHCCPAKGL